MAEGRSRPWGPAGAVERGFLAERAMSGKAAWGGRSSWSADCTEGRLFWAACV